MRALIASKGNAWTAVLLGVCLLIMFGAGSIYAKKTQDIKENLRVPDSNNVQIINTHSGATVIGRIVEIDSLKVDFVTDMGKLAIAISDISSIQEIPEKDLKDGKYWFPNPNATRLFFAPTGRMQAKGHGYFADYYVIAPMAAYGITDWLGIGGGFSFVPFIQIYKQALYLMPRVGFIQGDRFAWCGGVLGVKLPSFEDDYVIGAGIAYTTATYGTLDASVTAGTGYGFTVESERDSVTGEWAFEYSGMDLPMFMIGGEWRCARRVSLVSENWIIPDIEEGLPILFSYGARLFGEQISVDLGFIVPLPAIEEDIPIFPGIPYVDFVYNF
jgi:hypothetical protein